MSHYNPLCHTHMPVRTNNARIVNSRGDTVATASSENMAQDLAMLLNLGALAAVAENAKHEEQEKLLASILVDRMRIKS